MDRPVLSEAALYPASIRLSAALILISLFALLVPRRSPRPLPLAVLSVFAAVWLFGATLIWGTGSPSKLRWGMELTTAEGAALLALAAGGVLGAAGALRSFARDRHRAGWLLVALFAATFLGWSAVVRYSFVIVFIALAIALAAMWFASTPPAPAFAMPPKRSARRAEKQAASRPWLCNSITASLPVLAGPIFYWWLKASPKSWIDPTCGLASWLPLTFIPFIAVPGLAAWNRARTLNKSREAAAAAVLIAGFVAIAVCVVAFLVWFGANRCGE